MHSAYSTTGPQSPVSAILLASAVILMVTSIAGAQHLSLDGRVIDDSGTPIPEATIHILGTPYYTSTDISGRFLLSEIPPGRHAVCASKPGYIPRDTLAVQIVEDISQTVTLRMRRALVELPSRHVDASRAGISYSAASHRYIDIAELRGRGITDLRRALVDQPQVTIIGGAGTGGRSGAMYISLDGAPPRWVSVTLDGVPLGRDITGAVDISGLTLSALSGIEIVTGAQSASVGTGAMAGVVNLISNSGKNIGTRVEFQGAQGSFDHSQGTMSAGFRGADIGIRASASGEWHGASFAYTDTSGQEQTRNDVSGNARSLFAAGHVGSAARPFVTWSASMSDRRTGSPGALFQLTPHAQSRSHRTRVQFSQQGLTVAGGEMYLRGWWDDIEEDYESPERYRNDVRYAERLIGLQAGTERRTGEWRWSSEWEVVHERISGEDHLKPQTSFGVQHRTAGAARFQGSFSHSFSENWSFSTAASFSYDADDQFGGFGSPRGLAALQRRSWGRLAFGVGQGFQRPLLTSLFWKLDTFSEGNPYLRPERSVEWDVTLDVTPLQSVTLQSRYYRCKIEDIIVWERDFSGRFRPRNYDRADILGRDDRIDINVFDSHLRASYGHTFQHAVDRSGERNHEGKVLIYRPRHVHTCAVTLRIGRAALDARGRWVSDRFILRQNTKSLGPYRQFDLDARFVIHRGRPEMAVALHGQNVTDEWIELIERYPEPGRRWDIELGLKF